MTTPEPPDPPGSREAPGPGTTACPACGNVVPGGAYCGACGTHLAHDRLRGASRRRHAFAAFPDEPVLRLSVVTSLFPQLARGATAPFRRGLALLAVALLASALGGAEAPVVALSAVGVPVLFLLYVYETDPYERGAVAPTVALLVGGGALGLGWALVAGPVVAGALRPSLFPAPVTGLAALRAAVAAPVIGQVLMCVPVALLRIRPEHRRESLDGFTAGATGALGFTCVATITELSSSLYSGELAHVPFTGVLAQAVVRGVGVPVVAAALTGLVGAALYSDTRAAAREGRVLGSPLVALLAALAVQVGIGFADVARLADATLSAVHLAAAVLALLGLRVGLHAVLVHESHDARVGAPRACPHCHHVTPAMAFCPECGVAERATARPHRAWLAHGDGPPQDAPPPAGAGGTVGTAGARVSSFPVASALDMAGSRKLGHRRLVTVLVGSLAAVTLVLVVLALVLPPTPPAPCVRLSCDAAPSATPVEVAHLSDVGSGVTVRDFPAFDAKVTTVFHPPRAGVLEVDYESAGTPAMAGSLQIGAFARAGLGAQQWVDKVVASVAPNAVPDYTLPGAMVGYEPGYGESLHETVNSADGTSTTEELVVVASVGARVAVVVLAQGDRASLVNYLDHPTPALAYVATYADPVVNSVEWPGAPSR